MPGLCAERRGNAHLIPLSRRLIAMRFLRARRGMSIVEIVAATAIFALAITGLFSMITYAISADARTNARQQATEYAQEELDIIRRKAVKDIALASVPSGPNVPPEPTSPADQWHDKRPAGENETSAPSLVKNDSTITPYSDSADGPYRIYRYIMCIGEDDQGDTDDCIGDDPTTDITEDDRPLDRKVRVIVAHTGFDVQSRLSVIVSGNQVSESTAAGTTVATPGALAVRQISDTTLALSWTRPATGASSYAITQNTGAGEVELARTFYPNHIISDLDPEDAGRFIRFCVSAFAGDDESSRSDPTCTDFLTRPVGVQVAGTSGAGPMTVAFAGATPYAPIADVTPPSDANGNTLPGTLASGSTGGYVIERSSGGGAFAAVASNLNSTEAYTDPGDRCSDVYRVLVYRADVNPTNSGLVEGTDYAVSEEAVPECV